MARTAARHQGFAPLASGALDPDRLPGRCGRQGPFGHSARQLVPEKGLLGRERAIEIDAAGGVVTASPERPRREPCSGVRSR